MKKVLSLLLMAAVLISCLAAATVSVDAVTKLKPGYYVVGTFNNWTLDKDYRMSQPDAIEHYVLAQKKLSEGDELKVVYSSDGISKSAWYPDSGPSTNYIVYEDSYYDIEFSINTGQSLSAWTWQLSVEPCEPPTGDQPADPEPVINHTKELWDGRRAPTAEDIEEAVNEQFNSRTWIKAEDIMVFNSLRFDCTPAYVVDYGVKGYGIYCEVITEAYFGDYLFWSASSYEPSVYIDNQLYTFSQAYQAGILTQEMLRELVDADYRGGGYYGENSCRILQVIKGDADGDGVCNIIDATVIQRADARIISDLDYYRPLADVDGDSDVSVLDATLVQRSEVGLYTIE